MKTYALLNKAGEMRVVDVGHISLCPISKKKDLLYLKKNIIKKYRKNYKIVEVEIIPVRK
jgi:hypothetical protein